MAKNKKGTSGIFKILRYPSPTTLAIHSSLAKFLAGKQPELESALLKIFDLEHESVQKEGFKRIKDIMGKLTEKDNEIKQLLVELAIYCAMDLGLNSIKNELNHLIMAYPGESLQFMKNSSKRINLLFNPEIPLSHIDYLFSRYMEMSSSLSYNITQEEHKSIFKFIVQKVETTQRFHVQSNTYTVAVIEEYIYTYVILGYPQV